MVIGFWVLGDWGIGRSGDRERVGRKRWVDCGRGFQVGLRVWAPSKSLQPSDDPPKEDPSDVNACWGWADGIGIEFIPESALEHVGLRGLRGLRGLEAFSAGTSDLVMQGGWEEKAEEGKERQARGRLRQLKAFTSGETEANCWLDRSQ